MLDADKIFRAAVDEPAPPKPPETDEGQGDGGRGNNRSCLCRYSSLVVGPDGSVLSDGCGTALVIWFGLGSCAAIYLLVSWIVEHAQLMGLLVSWAIAISLAVCVVAISLHGIEVTLERWQQRRAGE